MCIITFLTVCDGDEYCRDDAEIEYNNDRYRYVRCVKRSMLFKHVIASVMAVKYDSHDKLINEKHTESFNQQQNLLSYKFILYPQGVLSSYVQYLHGTHADMCSPSRNCYTFQRFYYLCH
jgi:hypothetical protein